MPVFWNLHKFLHNLQSLRLFSVHSSHSKTFLSNILFWICNIVLEPNGTLNVTLACLRCCLIPNNSFLTYTDWTRNNLREYKSTQEDATRPEGKVNKTQLSTDPDSSRCEISGPRQCWTVHKPFANGSPLLAHSGTCLSQIYGCDGVWCKQDLITILRVKLWNLQHQLSASVFVDLHMLC